MSRVFVGLGSNLGDRAAHLAAARAALARRFTLVRASGVVETPALRPDGDPTPRPDFLNQVVELFTLESPEAVHQALKAMEVELGRTPAPRWESRTIDLDLLLHGERVVRTETLVVPHPGLSARRFVLAPLAELAPGLLHPANGRTIAALLAAL
ncbi:MAG: 2-amino-4-hydroxy-6-hydroxymethyldihydropteridine diphosphokinase [Myxococcaceae bacterium]|nr:2-amino-4-hydroxy-6-hydroxymethyldihydropteridine diphosphokinase [Myxococcaceae bacterium]